MNLQKKRIIDEELRINEIVRIMIASIDRTSKFVSLTHPNYDTFLYITEDTSIWIFDDVSYTVKPGDVLFIPKNIRYSRSFPSGHAGFIYLDFFFDIPKDVVLSPMLIPDFKDVQDLFFKLYRTWSARGLGYYSAALSIIYKIYSKIIFHSDHPYLSQKKRRLLEDVQNAFAERCTDPSFSVKDFIKKLGISETHFRRIFKTSYNMSPNQYLIFLRINRAKELLETGDQSIEEISELSGFASSSYFSRLFKERTGFSPYEFRVKFKR